MGEWHAVYGGSGADRWMQCYGSTALLGYLPEALEFVGNEYTEEGTVAHKVCERCLKEKRKPEEFLGMFVSGDGADFIRMSKPGWYEVTQEMVDAVNLFLMEIEYWSDLLGGDVYVELQVKLTETVGGTADAVITDPLGTTMVVVDFKYGAGHAVEVINNRQAQFYAYAMKTHLKVPAEEIVLVIVQPRATHPSGPVRRWQITDKDLDVFADNMWRAVARNEQKGAPLIPGESQCRWCNARPICPAAREVAINAARENFADVVSGPDLSDFDAMQILAQNLDAVEMVKGWLKTIEDAAHAVLTRDRKAIPGYKLVYGKQGNRVWKDEAAVIKELSKSKKVTKADYLTEPKLLSPAQLEKCDKIDKSWLESHVTRKDHSTKVVRVDAKGEDVPMPFADIVEADTDW